LELDENTLGTREKILKITLPTLPPPFKKRKTGPFMHACRLSLLAA